ncbi:MAG TPA: YigZ family protein, partial [Mangrovimonas sp.]|nr:YigZ family protein [Mangrovimonas sp.]
AYKTAAQMALNNSDIIEKTIDETLELKFNYALLNNVMRIIKEENLSIAQQSMKMDCKMVLTIRKKDLQKIKNRFENLYGVEVKLIP